MSSSQILLLLGTIKDDAQMTSRSMHGKPVFPMMIRKLPNRRGSTAFWNEIIESAVMVKPRLLNIAAGVNIPLVYE